MYIEAVPNRSSPPAILLHESYREAGKVKKRTLLNLTDWPTELAEGLRTLLKGGTALPPGQQALTIRRALPHGHVAAVLGMLRRRVAGRCSGRKKPLPLPALRRRERSSGVRGRACG
jgi:hypothetical protein